MCAIVLHVWHSLLQLEISTLVETWRLMRASFFRLCTHERPAVKLQVNGTSHTYFSGPNGRWDGDVETNETCMAELCRIFITVKLTNKQNVSIYRPIYVCANKTIVHVLLACSPSHFPIHHQQLGRQFVSLASPTSVKLTGWSAKLGLLSSLVQPSYYCSCNHHWLLRNLGRVLHRAAADPHRRQRRPRGHMTSPPDQWRHRHVDPRRRSIGQAKLGLLSSSSRSNVVDPPLPSQRWPTDRRPPISHSTSPASRSNQMPLAESFTCLPTTSYVRALDIRGVKQCCDTSVGPSVCLSVSVPGSETVHFTAIVTNRKPHDGNRTHCHNNS